MQIQMMVVVNLLFMVVLIVQAFNYNPLANADNNSCVPYIYGCTDPSMLNYNPSANTEDFSCIAYIYGCMDSAALNFDPLANTDNNSCIESGCGLHGSKWGV